MKVILIAEVDNLGEQGEIVSVKAGYGRNFLIPRKLARLATRGAVKAVEEERRQASRKIAAKKGDAEKLAAEIGAMNLVFKAKVGEENRIFGSVTAAKIAVAMASEGVVVNRRRIELDGDVRTLGAYTATVRIHADVEAKINFRVEPEGGVVPAPTPAPAPAVEDVEAPEAEAEAEAEAETE